MKISNHLAILITTLIAICSFTTCSDEGSSIKLLVIVHSKGFSGYYLKNGDEIKHFGIEDGELDTFEIGQYEEEIEDVDYLEISVTTNIGATSASIKIYKDNNKMKEESITGLDTGMSHTLTMDYEYGEGEEEE